MKKRLRGRTFISFLLLVSFSACAGAGRSLAATPVPTRAPLPTTPPLTTVQPTYSAPICGLPLPGPEDWPVLICETFDSPDSLFPAESQDNPYAVYSGATEDGHYTLDYAAKNFAAFTRTALTWFDIANAQDFAISINGQMDTRFKETSWGIGFRGSQDKESYFLFSIYNDGTYAFEIFENNGWIPLISRRPFAGITPDGENTVTVIAEGQNFRFLVNGEAVNFFTGGLLEGLQVFLMVSAREGATVIFTFDDVVVQI